MTSFAFDPANDEIIIAKPRKEIVFIESDIADIGTLINGIGRGKEIVILDASQDGLHQIAQVLAGKSGIDAVHIMSHGETGAAHLGSLILNSANLDTYRDDLQAIRQGMSADGDILLYGCRIGADGDAGFVQQLAIATGADVAASGDITGAAALGGNWDLEVVSGQVETAPVVDAQTAALYHDVLSINPGTVTFNDMTRAGGSGLNPANDSAKSGAGSDITYRVNGDFNYQLKIDGTSAGVVAYTGGRQIFSSTSSSSHETELTFSFVGGQLFTPNSISLANYNNFTFETEDFIIRGYDASGNPVGNPVFQTLSYNYIPTSVSLANLGSTPIKTLKIKAQDGAFNYLMIDSISISSVAPAAPKVASVTSSASGTHKIGDQIDIQVNYDSAVDVTGTPRLTMETGTTDSPATYLSGSGTSTLTFRYTVQAGDVTSDLDYNSSSVISPNGGTIKSHSDATVNASLTLPAAGGIGSLGVNAGIVIDGVPPTLSISSNKSLLGASDSAIITFTFSEDPGASFTAADVSVSGGTLGSINGSSGLTRTATFTPVSNGIATISVGAGTYADAIGNTNQGSSSLSFTVDTVAPSVAITSNKSVVTAGDTATITFTFSEDPGASFTWNGSSGDVVVSGGTLSAISGSGTTRTATFTPAAGLNGTAASITVNDKSYADTAGNLGAAGTTPSITVDTVAPTVSVTSDTPVLKAGETATITFTFSEDPGASFAWDGSSGDLTVSGGTLSALQGSGLTRTATFTPNANTNSGSASVSVKTLSFQDAAGNSNSAGGSTSITYDTKAPTLSISSDHASLKVGETATITFTFSENPGSSFGWDGSSGDIAVSGGTLSAISGSGTTRTATFTPTAGTDSGTASISVTGINYEDAAGNTGANASLSFGYDTLAPNNPSAPVLAGADDKGASSTDGITNKGTLLFSGTADPGATVRLYDTDGTTQIGSGSADGAGVWNITTSSLAAGTHTIKAKAFDAAGNVSALVSGQQVVIDTTAPTLSITSFPSTLKAGETATITFTFSEDPGTSFSWDGSAGSITVSGGTLSAISGSGTTRSATFTPNADTDAGSASISVASGAYHDLAGNNGAASNNLALSYDTLAPAASSAPDLDAASDKGTSSTDNLTNLTGLTFKGTAEAGATVKLYDSDGSTEIGSGSATGGNWTIATSTLGAGSHTVTAKVFDAAGNVSAVSGATTVTIDTSAPTLVISSDASQLKAGETATITFTFSEDPGATFTWDGTAGDVTVSGGTLSAISGTGTVRTAIFTPSANTNGGTASIGVSAGSYRDAAGNDGNAGATPSLHFDTLAPGAPSTPDLDTASDTGSSDSDNFTADTTPTFSGTAESGATVTLYDGATAIGSIVAAGGAWQITSDRALSAGAHTITAQAVDAAGNASAASSGLAVQIITSGPATGVKEMALSLDSGTAGDFVTNTAAQTISGLLDAVLTGGERVQVSLDGGTVWHDAVSSSGSDAWSIATTLAAGAHDIRVRVIDAIDNTGPVHIQAYTLDSVKPAVTITSDVTQLKAGQTAAITFTFSEDPGASFDAGDIVVGGGTLSAIAGNGLVRTAVFTPSADTDGGTASIAIKADSYEDAAGNLGSAGAPPSLSFDTLAPSAPSTPDLHKDSDSGASDSDNLTHDTALVLTGTAESGATVRLYDSNGSTEIGHATAAGGVWTIVTAALAEGEHAITAKAFDAAGNASAASGTITVTVDASNPAALAAPVLAAASDSGALGDAITKTTTPTFSGSAESLAQVTLYDGATAVGSVQAGADGAWQITATALADGVHAISARQVDRAGNASGAGADFSLTVDTVAPAAPAAPSLKASSDTGSIGDGVTENNIPVIEGTALADTLVTLYESIGGSKVKLGAAMADGSGKWSVASAGMSTGIHVLSATQTDAAGNESVASAGFTLRIAEPPMPIDLVDGMPVTVMPISLPGNVPGTAVSIPVVGADRAETSGQAGVADIPLVKSGQGAPILLAQLPAGYGLSASGANLPAANAGELLIAAIKAATPGHAPSDQGHLTGNGQSFLAGLGSSGSLLVETVKPLSSAAPDGVLALSGPAPGAGQSTALVIDAGGLAAGATIALQQVNFAAVIGAANLTAGSGMILSGDSASQHFTVAAGGTGSVFAGGGSDVLSIAAPAAAGPAPAAGVALLHGGAANDAATFSGARADYDIEFHNGYVMVSTKAAPDVKAMVVNVEQLQFSDASIAVQNKADMGTLAGIYQTMLGRQADVMGIEYWANVHQAGASWGAIVLDMIASSEHAASHEGFNGVAAHDLALLYTAIFNREADAGGMAYWSAALGRGLSLEQVASSFVESAEMVGHQRAAADWDFIVG